MKIIESVTWNGSNLAEVRDKFPLAYNKAGTMDLELYVANRAITVTLGDTILFDGENTFVQRGDEDES